MARKFPNGVRLDPDEVFRAQRVRVAMKLHNMPAEIDAMPLGDYQDLLEVMWADEQK